MALQGSAKLPFAEHVSARHCPFPVRGGGPCRGPRYIEVDVDVGSSRSAAHVVGLVQGALRSLVIDIAVLLEGHASVRAHPA